MGLFDRFRKQKPQTPPARPAQVPPARRLPLSEAIHSPNQPVRYEAAEKLTDQDLLLEVARTDGDEYVRCVAIRKLLDPKAALEIALRETSKKAREAAVLRYCELEKPQEFFPAALKLTDDHEAIARTARLLSVPLLEKALEGTEDVELIKEVNPPYVMGLIDIEKQALQRKQYACGARIRALEKRKAEEEAEKESAAFSTDEERAAFVKDRAKPAEIRLSLLREIRDDRLLADVLKSNPEPEIAETAVRAVSDPHLLPDAVTGLDSYTLHKIYPILIEKCPYYTPKVVAQDEGAPENERMKALENVKDQSVLLEIALRGRWSMKKPAIDLMTDRAALNEVAARSTDPFLRWRAAYRAGNTALMQEFERKAEKHVNGHAVIVTEHREWEIHRESCIRCGASYGCEYDSESTHHFGTDFSKFPCRPDVKPLDP